MPQVPSSLPEDQLHALVEHKFREGLWINHGCPIAVLYGDDGQMQCSMCRLDFKAMPLLDLCVLLTGLGRLHAGIVLRWETIDTAPKMRTILLFAVSDVADDGTVLNWKMATGSYHTGYDDERSREQGYSPWEWDGHQLMDYQLQPTHWMPLPKGPTT